MAAAHCRRTGAQVPRINGIDLDDPYFGWFQEDALRERRSLRDHLCIVLERVAQIEMALSGQAKAVIVRPSTEEISSRQLVTSTEGTEVPDKTKRPTQPASTW